MQTAHWLLIDVLEGFLKGWHCELQAIASVGKDAHEAGNAADSSECQRQAESLQRLILRTEQFLLELKDPKPNAFKDELRQRS